MSLSKRIRIDCSAQRADANDIFFNYDLLSTIFKNLRIIEILSIIQVHSVLYKYVKTDPKSLQVIKKCISYDFGKLLSSEDFELTKKYYRDALFIR